MRRYRGMRIVLGVIFISLSVGAQTAEEMATRRTLLDEARKASNARDHAQALSLAAHAAEIRMTPSLRLFIAQEQSLVGQFGNSIANAELCALEATEDKALKNRKKILGTCKDLIAELQKSAARIIVSWLKPVPPHAQVLINGQVVPESLYGGPYTVSPGYVRVEASALGYIRFYRELEVEPQEEVIVTLGLTEDLAPQAVERPADSDATVVAAETSRSPPNREAVVVSAGSEGQTTGPVGAYLLLGVGAASSSASAAFLIIRNNALNKLDAQCGGPSHSVCTDTPDSRSLRSKASTYSVLTDVALGVGSAAVVGGAIWLFYEKARRRRTPPHAELQIRPTQGGAVVGVGGTL